LNYLESLNVRAKDIANIINKQISNGINPLILSDAETDGVTAASIIAKAIQKKNCKPVIRVVDWLDHGLLQDIKESGYNWIIFCNIGAGMVSKIESVFDDQWIIIDRHFISKEESVNKNVLNINQFNLNEEIEDSTSTIAHILASKIDSSNTDSSWMAVMASLSAGLDKGEGRSLTGINKLVLDEALNSDFVKCSVELLFSGRETKPIHEAISSTIEPYIPNLTGNNDATIAVLRSIGINYKNSGSRWKTLSDLSEEQNKELVELLIPYVSASENAEEVLGEIIGNVYTLNKEEEHSPLRDAREFAILIESCIKNGNYGIALAICLGDRDKMLLDAEALMEKYKKNINKCLVSILNDEDIIIETTKSFIIKVDGFVKEELMSKISSILSKIKRFENKIIILKSNTAGSEVIIHIVSNIKQNSSVNVGEIMFECNNKIGGIGIGSKFDGKARIPLSKSEEFIKLINAKL
jgi:RecJ-like exonuclease